MDIDAITSASPWFTANEVAAYLKLKLGTIRNMTSARRIPFARRKGIVRYHRNHIDAWMSRGECPGRQTAADVGKRRENNNGVVVAASAPFEEV